MTHDVHDVHDVHDDPAGCLDAALFGLHGAGPDERKQSFQHGQEALHALRQQLIEAWNLAKVFYDGLEPELRARLDSIPETHPWLVEVDE